MATDEEKARGAKVGPCLGIRTWQAHAHEWRLYESEWEMAAVSRRFGSRGALMPIDIRVGDEHPKGEEPSGKTHRPFLGVKFLCANSVYNRFYKNAEGTMYTGRCPSCLKEVRVGIGSHGTDSRFFTYDCGR